MLSSMNATHLNSAGNRTKTVTLSLLLKMMALCAPETKNAQLEPIPLSRKTGYPGEFNSPNMLTANIVGNNNLSTIILKSLVV